MARPTINDPAVATVVARKIAPKIVQWLKDAGDTPDADDVEADCLKIIGHSYSYDGYRLAEKFDDEGYEPDAELVRILDDTLFRVHEAVSDAEKAWVAENGLTGPAIGAMVSFVSQKYPKLVAIGEVTENHTHGHSTVFCESLGHVREGCGTHGLLVPWEDLTVT